MSCLCDRCVHITDIGVGYISTMQSLIALFLRWCSQLRDFGVQHLCGMRSLQLLSLAGTYQPWSSHNTVKQFDVFNTKFTFWPTRLSTPDVGWPLKYHPVASAARAWTNQLPRRFAWTLRLSAWTPAAMCHYWINTGNLSYYNGNVSEIPETVLRVPLLPSTMKGKNLILRLLKLKKIRIYV